MCLSHFTSISKGSNFSLKSSYQESTEINCFWFFAPLHTIQTLTASLQRLKTLLTNDLLNPYHASDSVTPSGKGIGLTPHRLSLNQCSLQHKLCFHEWVVSVLWMAQALKLGYKPYQGSYGAFRFNQLWKLALQSTRIDLEDYPSCFGEARYRLIVTSLHLLVDLQAHVCSLL